HAQQLEAARENVEFLPGVHLHDGIEVTASLESALAGADLLVVVVPSHVVRKTLQNARSYLDPRTRIVCASKGVEQGSLALMGDVICQALTDDAEQARALKKKIAALSGPSFAKEVARRVPTSLVAASRDAEFAQLLQATFSAP